jgi:hypothetical protein
VAAEPAPLSESAEDSLPGTGTALTSDASRSSTNYNLDGKDLNHMHRCARHFFLEGRGKFIAHDI